MSSVDDSAEDLFQENDPVESAEDLNPDDIKAEDAREDLDLPDDADVNERQASGDEDQPVHDDGMDLFGEDEVAEEVKHDTA